MHVFRSSKLRGSSNTYTMSFTKPHKKKAHGEMSGDFGNSLFLEIDDTTYECFCKQDCIFQNVYKTHFALKKQIPFSLMCSNMYAQNDFIIVF